ncbi:hypothetical protein GC163_19340 [bacterium]|nr:hypothetical protein [bacterium]
MAHLKTTAGDRNRGPWWHRWALRLCTLVLFGLLYKTIGFLTDDIWRIDGPDFAVIEEKFLDADLLKQEEELQQRSEQLERQLRDQTTQQLQHRELTATSQKTWTQLVEFRKLAVEKNQQLSDAEQRALDQAQELFLQNQQAELAVQERIGQLTSQTHQARDALQDLHPQLQKQRDLAQEEYANLWESHRRWLGWMQLSVLIPSLLISAWLLYAFRNSPWKPFSHALAGAVFLKVWATLNEHFAFDVLIYPLVATGLLVVGAMLWGLIRTLTRPKTSWLLRQYRDAYESYLCPVCDYPIRRGPMTYLYWTRKTLKKLTSSTTDLPPNEPYTCPCCATALFEECPSCHKTRHSLLPACECCGEVKDMSTTPA